MYYHCKCLDKTGGLFLSDHEQNEQDSKIYLCTKYYTAIIISIDSIPIFISTASSLLGIPECWSQRCRKRCFPLNTAVGILKKVKVQTIIYPNIFSNVVLLS